MVSIIADDDGVTVGRGTEVLGYYPFGLTGSDLFALLEQIEVPATYEYNPTPQPTEDVTEEIV